MTVPTPRSKRTKQCAAKSKQSRWDRSPMIHLCKMMQSRMKIVPHKTFISRTMDSPANQQFLRSILWSTFSGCLASSKLNVIGPWLQLVLLLISKVGLGGLFFSWIFMSLCLTNLRAGLPICCLNWVPWG